MPWTNMRRCFRMLFVLLVSRAALVVSRVDDFSHSCKLEVTKDLQCRGAAG
jgi:hypothetical protein